MSITLQLYKYETSSISTGRQWPATYLDYQLLVYCPGLFSFSRYGEKYLINLFWYIFTLGNFRVLCLLDKDIIVHYSYITPKMFRFPFMKKNDIQIGPCATNPAYQKKGIFTNVLKLINEVCSSDDRTIWIYTSMNNFSSQKAFERSGFKFVSLVSMSNWSKVLKIKRVNG